MSTAVNVISDCTMIKTNLKNSSGDSCNVSPHYKILFIAVLLILFYSYTSIKTGSHSFDYFVFSQRWLPTACIEYMEHGSSHSAQCILPQIYDFWAIHGLWPTKNNHMGPFFCNKSMVFDANKLLPIKSLLQSYWPNIEAGESVDSLWQHEWDKHGTCAAQIELLNSEFKYFNITTLNLYKNYNIQKIFKNITPSLNNTIKISDIFLSVLSTFKKLPQIHCIHEVKKHGKAYLSEIRLCFNKSLELIHCGNMATCNSNSTLCFKNFTDCPLDGNVYLPDKINPLIKE